jgi:hypothetical protein
VDNAYIAPEPVWSPIVRTTLNLKLGLGGVLGGFSDLERSAAARGLNTSVQSTGFMKRALTVEGRPETVTGFVADVREWSSWGISSGNFSDWQRFNRGY